MVDLNLYPVFIEIMRHGSVTKAAEALGLTQSATSNALSRLRHQMDDPLFLRNKSGMMPTHFARSKLHEIEEAVHTLSQLQSAKEDDLPDLKEIKRHFTMVTSDLEETLFLPELIDHLNDVAPNITLEVNQYRSDRIQQDLEKERIDLCLAYMSDPFKNIVSQPVQHQKFCCLTSRDHPVTNTELTLANYIAYKHVLVAPDRGGMKGLVDNLLKQMDMKRHVAIAVPHFLSACLLISNSQYLLTIPKALGEKVGEKFDLKIHDLPFDMPGFTIGLHWHWIRDSDTEHRLLRNEILKKLKSA